MVRNHEVQAVTSNDELQARARLAATRAHKLRGTQWLPFARMMTRNSKLKMEFTKDVPKTDGNTIWVKVPIALGDDTPHTTSVCGRRDARSRMLCPACEVFDEVQNIIFHEVAHIAFDSFEEMNEWDRVQATKDAIARLAAGQPDSSRAKKLVRKFEKYRPRVFSEAAGLVSPWLYPVMNSVEDGRVNAAMMSARVGTRGGFKAMVNTVFDEGIETADGTRIFWAEQSRDMQAILAIFCKVTEAEYAPYLNPQVVEVLDDPELDRLCAQSRFNTSARGSFNDSIAILERLRQLDFCIEPDDEEDDEPEPEQQQQPQQDESDNDNDDNAEDNPESGEDDSDGQDDSDESDSGDDKSDGDEQEQPGSDSDDKGDDEDDQQDSGDGGDSSDRDDHDSDEEPSDSGAEDNQTEEKVNDDASDETQGDDGDSDGDDEGDQQSSESDDQDDSSEHDSDDDSDSGSGKSESEDQSDEPGDGADSDEVNDDDSGEGSEAGQTPTAPSGMGNQDDEVPQEGAEEPTQGTPSGPGAGNGAGLPDQNDNSTDDSELDAEDDAKDPLPERGDPNEVSELFDAFAGHNGTDGHVVGQEDEDFDSEMVDLAIAIALSQVGTMDKPSANVSGVKMNRWSDAERGEGWAGSSFLTEMYGLDRFRKPVEVPEHILMASLGRLRYVFSENKKSHFNRDLKSGRINTRVLGRRVATGDDRLFQKKNKPKKRDWFVQLGLDISGSTATKDTLQIIKESGYAMAELLNRLGIRFAIHAHTGDFQRETRMLEVGLYEVKAANEPWGAEQRERLQALVPSSGNVDGHTMEAYRKMLDAEKATDKLLIYSTDGEMPATNYDEELEILQREIHVCKQKRYHLVGLGIRSDSPTDHGLDTIQLDSIDDVPMFVTELEKRISK